MYRLIKRNIIRLKESKITNNIVMSKKRARFIDPTPLYSNSISSRVKRRRTLGINRHHLDNPSYVVNDTWVSATGLWNFFMKDPVIDVLDLRERQKVNPSSSMHGISEKKTTNSFMEFIMQRGNEFEDAVMKLLYKRFGRNIRQIATHYQARLPEKAQETFEAMKEGVPIIYQGVLHNPNNKTFGLPDLLVRSDYVNKIINEKVLNRSEINMGASELCHNNYHYRVVDIKFKTIHLRSNGTEMLNSGSMAAQKGQLCIYNQALGLTQGYTPSCAYVLGRKWVYTQRGEKYSGNNCFDKYGIINFVGFDNMYIEKINEGLQWIQDVRTGQHNWTLIPPSREELYPNMSNTYDGVWRKEKERISKEIKEITGLWQCGVSNREKAHTAGVYGWDDLKCTPQLLGHKSPNRVKVINEMLRLNRQSVEQISPDDIHDDMDGWQTKPSLELYVDFEFVSDLVTDFNSLLRSETFGMVFMIGCGWEEKGEWNYKAFTANRLNNTEEKVLFDKFNNFIDDLTDRIVKDDKYEPRLVHWGNAERIQYEKAYERHYPNTWQLDTWFDMLELFKREPIIIKDCLGFSLKQVAKTMKEKSMIKSTWNSQCSDGMAAMVQAYKCDKEAEKKGITLNDIPAIKDIEAYNETDVQVLWEIITYLRKNHTK